MPDRTEVYPTTVVHAVRSSRMSDLTEATLAEAAEAAEAMSLVKAEAALEALELIEEASERRLEATAVALDSMPLPMEFPTPPTAEVKVA